jgi:hypothetical protein
MGKAKRLKKIRQETKKLLSTGVYSDGEQKHTKKIIGLNSDGTLKILQPVTKFTAYGLAKKDAKKNL